MIYSRSPSLQTPKGVCVSPPVLLLVLHCFQCKQSPSFLPLPFTHPFTVVDKMSCERSDFLLSLCLLVIAIFFQVNGVLPILPLLFPVLWILATAFGEARVLAQMSKASSTSLVGISPLQRKGQEMRRAL